LNRLVPKSPRPRGRPRSFDENDAVAGATRIFWEKGFDGSTIDDLVAGMGVGRPSLYAIFGDKMTLFRRCLHAYGDRHGTLGARALLEPAHVADAIRGFLRYSVESASAKDSPWGCLMVCVAPLVDDPEVREFLRSVSAEAVAMVERRFQRGVEAGELPRGFAASTRARQVIDLARGLTVHARMGAPRKELLADADNAAALVLG
jgi:AcrR family transcriptional regulator